MQQFKNEVHKLSNNEILSARLFKRYPTKHLLMYSCFVQIQKDAQDYPHLETINKKLINQKCSPRCKYRISSCLIKIIKQTAGEYSINFHEKRYKSGHSYYFW